MTPRPRSSRGDRAFQLVTQTAGLFVVSVAAALVGVLVYQAWPALVRLARLGELPVLTSLNWDPGSDSYGALLFGYGTVATSRIAMIVAVPLGVGGAAYLSEVAPPRVRKVSSFLLELLAAIPSVIFGFWALQFLARRGLGPAFSLFEFENTSGRGILSAGLVLPFARPGSSPRADWRGRGKGDGGAAGDHHGRATGGRAGGRETAH